MLLIIWIMFVFVMVANVGKTMIGVVVFAPKQQEKWLAIYEMKLLRF